MTALSIIPTHEENQRLIDMANRAAKSGLFRSLGNSADVAYIIMAKGIELQIPPMTALEGFTVVQGKIAYTSNLQATLMKRAGYSWKILQHTKEVCEIEVYNPDKTVAGISLFTIEDARDAGLLKNATWQNYPKNMLFARAIGNAAKWLATEVFGGAAPLTAEELGANVDEDGNVIEHAPRATEDSQLPANVSTFPPPQAQTEQDKLFLKIKEVAGRITNEDGSPVKPEEKIAWVLSIVKKTAKEQGESDDISFTNKEGNLRADLMRDYLMARTPEVLQLIIDKMEESFLPAKPTTPAAPAEKPKKSSTGKAPDALVEKIKAQTVKAEAVWNHYLGVYEGDTAAEDTVAFFIEMFGQEFANHEDVISYLVRQAPEDLDALIAPDENEGE